jgi:flagellar biosynthetic protein FlhB
VRALFEGGKTIVKTCVVAVAAFVAIWPRLQDLGQLAGAPPGEIMSRLGSSVMMLALYVCVAFLVIGIVDFTWQRYQHEKSLKMTKEEVRQESRQSDLAPEVRGAIRRRQFARARQRMIADVATADVVVTNPTHFAVALRYDGSRPAPEMVAKGVDLVAAAIRKAAEDAGVPVLQNPPLARALHKEVEIGQMIPDSFFAAVAEVLAFVYRTARRRRKAS